MGFQPQPKRLRCGRSKNASAKLHWTAEREFGCISGPAKARDGSRFLTSLQLTPALKKVEYQANEAKGEIIKAVADDNGGRVMGIDLTKEVAIEISSVDRQLSTEVTLAGQYTVAKVDTTAADGFKVTLEDIKTGDHVAASLFDALISAEHKEIIKNAEANICGNGRSSLAVSSPLSRLGPSENSC